jgi:cysteine synthase
MKSGVEIVSQLGSRIDAFVMGVGTGGTLMGVAEALRKAGSNARIVAVEPAESAVMSGEQPGHHGIQDLADGFIPEIVQLSRIDRIVKVGTAEAICMAKRLACEEGMLVGISSGANVAAAMEIAAELDPKGRVVTVRPDRGDRYLSVYSTTN